MRDELQNELFSLIPALKVVWRSPLCADVDGDRPDTSDDGAYNNVLHNELVSGPHSSLRACVEQADVQDKLSRKPRGGAGC